MTEKIVQILIGPDNQSWQGGLIGLSSTGAVYLENEGKWELTIPALGDKGQTPNPEPVLGLERVPAGAPVSSCIDRKGRRVAMWIEGGLVMVHDADQPGSLRGWGRAQAFWEANQ